MDPVINPTYQVNVSKEDLRQSAFLLAGDVVTLGLVTIFGFATHGTFSSAGMRMFSTFIPLVIAWLLVAPHLGVFNLQVIKNYRNLWRPFWAMLLAAPMAAWSMVKRSDSADFCNCSGRLQRTGSARLAQHLFFDRAEEANIENG